MNDNDIKTPPQVRAFLDGTRAVEFSLNARSERYDFVRRTLIRLAYHALSKSDKEKAKTHEKKATKSSLIFMRTPPSCVDD